MGEPKDGGEAKGMLGTALQPPCKAPLLAEQELSAFPPPVLGLQSLWVLNGAGKPLSIPALVQ